VISVHSPCATHFWPTLHLNAGPLTRLELTLSRPSVCFTDTPTSARLASNMHLIAVYSVIPLSSLIRCMHPRQPSPLPLPD
jgi:hypothetical protein